MKPLYNRVIFAAGSQVWNRTADLVTGPVADRVVERMNDFRVQDRIKEAVR